MTTPRRPPGLKQAGAALWRAIANDGLGEPSQTALDTACRLLDEIRGMEEALAEQGLTVTGSMGQQRQNPLIGEVRQHRLALLRALNVIEQPAAEPDAEEPSVSTLAFRRLRRRALARRLGIPFELAELLRDEDDPHA